MHTLLAVHAVDKLGETFDEQGALLHIELPAERVEGLKIQLRDATRGKVRWSEGK